ncbi:MAG: DNA-processing protein DprA [Candidatus Omnitrophota bacterium]|jgi:DNA processing protein
MTDLEALVGLNMVCDVGSIRLKKLLDVFGKPEYILRAPREKIISVCGIGTSIAGRIGSFKAADLHREFQLIKKQGIKLLTLGESGYPENLLHIPDPPIVLYVRGKFAPSDKQSLALVGSRQASFYGVSCAQKFARELSERGFTIVSGMARGIDTAAHHAALKQHGRTIAVMGSGFNHIYPPENQSLVEKIIQSGAVISEFSMETGPWKQNFPRRNRVISGLSRGVLVVEAARNSGALITVGFALEQGREVFALPGNLGTRNSCGGHALIKQGAKLVACVEDIIEEFAPLQTMSQSHALRPVPTRGERTNSRSLCAEEIQVYDLISSDPVSLDEIAGQVDMGTAFVSGVLFRLQVQKLIKQLPGKQFIRDHDEEKKLSYC